MKLKENVDLSKLVKIKVGGIAESVYYPETIEELLEVYSEENTLFISNGNNLLINDKKVFKKVVVLSQFNSKIDQLDDGLFVVGASVSLQKLVKKVNEAGYGGIENLMYVPGLVGAAVSMNAGTGIDRAIYIGNYIKKVKYIDSLGVHEISREECMFTHRGSIFKNDKKIIIELVFNFPTKSKEEITAEIEWKKESANVSQDLRYPTFGSIFSICNPRILKVSYFVSRVLFSKGMVLSKKNHNWMTNLGKGTYSQAVFIINLSKFLHKIFLSKIKTEVVIWR